MSSEAKRADDEIRWERLLDLQGLQREDMLRQFMEKQQRIARAKIDSAGSN